MSNTYTTTSTFSTYNYTGTPSLTGYTLPISEFKFEVTSDIFKTGKVFWDFGDNTNSTGLTARHFYTLPGTYLVTNYFYDSGGQVYKNTFTQTISVKDFITDFLYLSTATQDLESCLATNQNNFECITQEIGGVDTGVPLLVVPSINAFILQAGKIATTADTTIFLVRQNSWQTWPALSATGYTINCFTSGGIGSFFDQGLNKNKYGHLYPYTSFYQLHNSEVVEVSSIDTSNITLYCVLSNNNIVLCDSSVPGSVFCGTKGSASVYFKSDLPVDPIYLFFQFDKSTFTDTLTYDTRHGTFGYINTFAVGLSAKVYPNSDYTSLAVTANGLAGEGYVSNVFNIDTNKFTNMPINFVVTIKDIDFFTIKANPLLSANSTGGLNDLSIVALDGNNTPVPGKFNSYVDGLTGLTTGGFYKGQFIPYTPATNVTIAVSGIVGDDLLTANLITGSSNTFNIFSSAGGYNLAKINENYNLAQSVKDLRFQEFLLDDPVLFDDFLTTIYGDVSADVFSLGKMAYEKIANFTMNQVDIEKCHVDSLISLNQMLGNDLTRFEQNNFRYPAKLKRIIDLLSINHSRLWGTRNKFNQNLDPNFGINSFRFGLNTGKELDVATTVLTARDGYIVAQEKYSGIYKLCNLFVPFVTATDCLCDERFICFAQADGEILTIKVLNTGSTSDTYPLSNYNSNWKPLSNYSSSWGWPLNNAGVSGTDIGKYYRFYEYVPTTDNTLVNNVINFNDPINTLSETLSSYTTWITGGGIMENIINYSLYTGVKLLTAS